MSETTQTGEADWFSQLREGVAESNGEAEDTGEGNGEKVRANEGGRPPKPDAEKKTERFTVYCTKAQKAQIEDKAEAAGIAAAAFIRSAALGEDLTGEVNVETRRLLRRIGVNLNQLTKVANSTGDIEAAERLDIVLDAVNKAARRIR